jgi:hypothetical protein
LERLLDLSMRSTHVGGVLAARLAALVRACPDVAPLYARVLAEMALFGQVRTTLDAFTDSAIAHDGSVRTPTRQPMPYAHSPPRRTVARG